MSSLHHGWLENYTQPFIYLSTPIKLIKPGQCGAIATTDMKSRYTSTDLLSWLNPFAGETRSEHNIVEKKRIICSLALLHWLLQPPTSHSHARVMVVVVGRAGKWGAAIAFLLDAHLRWRGDRRV